MASLRRIPRTDQLLADPRMAAAQRRLGRDLVKAAIARAQQRARNAEITPGEVADAAVAELPLAAASLTPVINATGVLVHTNLGRAPLSAAARAAIAAAAGTCDVEFDLATGNRARQRGRGVIEALGRAVPNAQAAGVVNNNAAALVLAATALAAGREIIISRGELIEIGDRFRLPDLLSSTGARLREVGTTNRTTVEDYQQAVGEHTGFILKVHPSNYRVEGFTRSASVAELAALNVTLVHDIGSGLLAPHPLLPDEPDAATSLAHGANLVTASGDKLLGGPQAGLLLGDEPLVRRLLRHPLARALRVDKLTLAALEATVSGPLPPVARALSADPAVLAEPGRAGRGRADRAAGPGQRDAGRGGGRRRRRPRRDPAQRGRGAARGTGGGAARRARGTPRRDAGRRRPAGKGPPAARPAVSRPGRRRPADRGRPRGQPEQHLMYVVATAGHVDHGKSTLVRVLTGMEPDRWAEERRRGMTIDLGYAWMTAGPAGAQLAFVDVPGHERFVPNMLAGLGPVPAVLFVVAADGGWMPQSAEHLAAVDALGVRHGLLAVTRADLADPAPATRQARLRSPGPASAQSRRSRSAPSPVRAWTSCGPPWTALSARYARRRLPPARPVRRPRRSGCGSTARSPSAAPGPWSPARCPPARSGTTRSCS